MEVLEKYCHFLRKSKLLLINKDRKEINKVNILIIRWHRKRESFSTNNIGFKTHYFTQNLLKLNIFVSVAMLLCLWWSDFILYLCSKLILAKYLHIGKIKKRRSKYLIKELLLPYNSIFKCIAIFEQRLLNF